MVFGLAANTSLQKLDRILYQELRLCTGAFRTAALQVERGEEPRLLPRMQLSLNYWVNLQGHEQDHPTQHVLKPCWEKERYEVKSFGWTAAEKATISK